MTTEEVLSQLRDPDDTIPHDAIAAVIARPEEFVPLLIAEIEKATELADKADLDDCLASFALYLLAQLRETRALEPILAFFALDETTGEDLFGDVIAADGGRILAAVGHDRPERLHAYALEPNRSAWVRSATWEALVAQVMWGEKPREPLVEYFHGLFAGNVFLQDVDAWSFLIDACLEFDPREFLEPIRGLYERELADIFFVGEFDEVEADAAKDPAEIRKAFLERVQPLTDTGEAVSWWGNFSEADPSLDYGDGDWQSSPDDIPLPEPIRNDTPKIGRNDLCPCGSGKKYKKCCLAAQQ